MGVDRYSAQFLWNQKKRGVSFRRMLSLGRQTMYMPQPQYQAHLKAMGVTQTEFAFADDFLRGLGAEAMDFMDVSQYEGANVIHDLNEPLPVGLAGSYDCVFDGGALEHVFNFPTALKSCMDLVRPGGHLIIITPWNNFAGHGFYQFSPELFYSALSEANGYSVEQMVIVQKDRWYAVADPRKIRARVQLMNGLPTLLFLTAKRQAIQPVFSRWPQQSDYSLEWSAAGAAVPKPVEPASFKSALVAKSRWLSNLHSRWRFYKYWKGFTLANRRFFQPLDPATFPVSIERV